MSYYTGVINNITELKSAVLNALDVEDWDVSGDWAFKDGLHGGGERIGFEFTVATSSPYSSKWMSVRARNGDLSHSSATYAPYSPYIGGGNWTGVSAELNVVYPATYFIHVFDYEVFVVIQYGVDKYQHLCFGQSKIKMPGTGAFIWGPQVNITGYSTTTSFGNYVSSGYILGSPGGSIGGSGGTLAGNVCLMGIPFSQTLQLAPSSGFPVVDAINTGFVDSGAGGSNSWTLGITNNDVIIGQYPSGMLHTFIPNAFNAEAVLLPLRAYKSYTSGTGFPVLELESCKLTRNDYYQPGQVVQIGITRWKIYPCLRRNTTDRIPTGVSGLHSGTYALAIRYDGP